MHSEPSGLHSIAHLCIKPENIIFKFPLEGLERNRDNLLANWDAITYKLGDFGTSAYLTHIVQTVNEEAGTIPYEAPEIEDLLRVRRDIEAKPCDIY